MESVKDMRRSIEKLTVASSAGIHSRILEKLSIVLEESRSRKPKTAALRPCPWRRFMRSRLTQLATAALMITAVALSISFLEQSVTPAYAIEQTVEACRDLRFLYFEYFAPRDSEPIKECWIEFDSNGQPKDVRTDLHAHWNVVHIWKEGRTQTWRKEDNTLRSYEDEAFTAKILKLVRDCTPSTAVESLYERQLNGEVEIEISQPDDKTEPIAIKGTFLPGRYLLDNPTLPSFRDILYVDQTTKLVTAIEVYELRDGEYQPNGVWRSYKYNEPFGAEVFDIEGEVPDDVTRLQSAY